MAICARFALVICLVSAAFAQAPVPRPAKEFHMVDPAGKTVQLRDYRGKVLVVQFLFTSCVHCQATARMLSRLEGELGAEGLQVVGVAFNPETQEDGALMRQFSQANQVSFPVGAASRESVFGFLGAPLMERMMVPQIVVIDRRGVIQAQSRSAGSPELQDEGHLRELLRPLLGARPAKTTSAILTRHAGRAHFRVASANDGRLLRAGGPV